MKRLRERGFTFVEIAIVAPIVILAIGSFITVVVGMTGEVLTSRSSTQLLYSVQDALNRIDQDVKLSSGFIAETNVPITSPQGYDDNTAVFDNVDSTKGTMLVLNVLGTTGNPLDSSSSIAYLNNSPNPCGSLQGQNTPIVYNVVYFVKNNTLWRRTIAPANYATAACNAAGTGTAAPYQQPTCPNISTYYSYSFCSGFDESLVDGVSTSGFTIQYYNNASTNNENSAASANPTCNTTGCVATRNSALQSATTVNVTIDAHKTVAAKDVEQIASIRSTRLDTNASAVAPVPTVSTPSVPTVSGKTPNINGTTASSTNVPQALITWTPSSGNGTMTYNLKYQINGGTLQTVNGLANAASPSYIIPGASFGNVITAQVQASNSAGNSAWSSVATLTVPAYASPQMQNGWHSYNPGWATPGFSQSPDGTVYLKGLIAGGTASSGTAFFTLPAGFRPSEHLVFGGATTDGTNDVHGRVDVDPNGTVQFQVGNAAYISLDGINFVASGSTLDSNFANYTLANGWLNYGSPYATPQYVIDGSHRLHLKGLIKSGSGYFTTLSQSPLPTAPTYDMYVGTDSNNGFGDYTIASTTNPSRIAPVAGSNSWYSIQAMYYSAAWSDVTWTNLSMSNGWSNYGGTFAPLQYTKAPDGVVTIRGFIKGGTSGVALATLPASYRPRYRELYQVASWDQYGRVDVDGSGNIFVVKTANNGWVSLDGISYVAEQ